MVQIEGTFEFLGAGPKHSGCKSSTDQTKHASPAVVQIEDTEFLGAGPDGTKRVRIKISVPPGYDVRQVRGARAFISSRLAGLRLLVGVHTCRAAVQLHACHAAQPPLDRNLTAAAAALLPSSPLHCDRWAVTWRQAKWSLRRGTTSTPLKSASWRLWVPPPCSESRLRTKQCWAL